jgi:hypothetical protein
VVLCRWSFHLRLLLTPENINVKLEYQDKMIRISIKEQSLQGRNLAVLKAIPSFLVLRKPGTSNYILNT